MVSNDPSYEPYYFDNDNGLLGMMNQVYEQNSDQWMEFFYQGDIDSRFYAGDQQAITNYFSNTYNTRNQNIMSFNKIRTIINMISGHQRKNRKTSIVIPQEVNDQDAADQASDLLMYVNNFGNVYENLSTAFEGALITGFNLIHTWLDYTNDPVNGDIRTNVVPYNAFIIDPYFQKMDLSDCNYIWTRKYISKDEAKQLLPDRGDEVDALHYDGHKDGKFPFMPENFNFAGQNLLAYDEFWYKSTREEKVILDTQTGETHPWSGEDENLELYLDLYPQLKIIKRTIPTVKLGIIINGKVFYHGANIFNIDNYPFVPVVAYFHPELEYMYNRIQGVVRNLRDIQWSYNRRMRIQLDLLESQVTSGLKVIEDSLVDPNDAFLQGQGRVLWIKKEAGLDSVQEIPPPQIPPSWFQEVEKLNADMKEVSGVTEELLGSSDTDTGITQMLRQGAGLTTLQPLFDKLNVSQVTLGKLTLEIIRKNYSPGKIARILGEEPNPILENKYFYKFDIQVTEGILTETQQKMQFAQLLEMQQMGIPIPPSVLIKAAPLQDKKELIEGLQQQAEQQEQQQQQTLAVQMELLQAQIEDLKAKAVANTGLGIERTARVDENEALAVERLAEAKKDRELGALHLVKALKELEGMDISNLMQSIQAIKAVQEVGAQLEPGTPRSAAVPKEQAQKLVEEEIATS